MSTIPTHTEDGREIAYWETDLGAEELMHTDVDEAVDAWADKIFPSPVPETVVVYGFARMQIRDSDVRYAGQYALEVVLERFDEEHGNQVDTPEPATDAMKVAAQEFAEKIRSLYSVWSCEKVVTLTVNTRDYLDADLFEQLPSVTDLS